MRVATVSDCASTPNFTFQFTPRASLTLNFGEAPVGSSSTKVNGATGARSAAPGPQRILRLEMSPGSRHKIGVPVGSGFLVLGFLASCASATEEKAAINVNSRNSRFEICEN